MPTTSVPQMSLFNAALLAILPVVIVAVAASLVTTPNIPGWYATLNKPSFNPPNWIFGPVWSLLYVMMAYAFYRILTTPSRGRALAIAAFLVQIVLNGLWSFAFFGAHDPLLAMVVIVALWCAILVALVLFWHIDRPAGVLLVPYLAWVSFATLLNAAILTLN
jgi:benzodiazapine receptor